MKYTFKKVFLDIKKEEEWLNEQGQTGLMLLGCHNGAYEFEKVSPVQYEYKIDTPSYSGNKKKDYLEFLENTGISVATEYGGKIYLRKNIEDGPLDLYTDKQDIQKQINKRLSFYFITAISQFFLGGLLLTQGFFYENVSDVATWIRYIFGTGFMISALVFLYLGISKYRNYSENKEKINVWE